MLFVSKIQDVEIKKKNFIPYNFTKLGNVFGVIHISAKKISLINFTNGVWYG